MNKNYKNKTFHVVKTVHKNGNLTIGPHDDSIRFASPVKHGIKNLYPFVQVMNGNIVAAFKTDQILVVNK